MVDDARPLLKHLFDFLEAYDQKRNPVIADVSRHEKVWWWHSFSESKYLRLAPIGDPPPTEADGDEDDFVVTVSRPTLPEPPQPPANLTSWLLTGWDDPRRDAAWRLERDDPELGHVTLDEPDLARLNEWKARRDAWAEQAIEKIVAFDFFQWLWDVQSTLEREGERFELVLGDGVLVWDAEGTAVIHPLLIQRLQIQFDPAIPAFTVIDADRPPELHASLLRSTGADPVVIGRLLERVRSERPHPLWADQTDDFLRQAASELHAQGEFMGRGPLPPARLYPQIIRSPVIFLRKRMLGFETAIQAIKEDLEAGGDIPDSLAALVGVAQSTGNDAQIFDPFEQGDETEDILFTKEANREQLEIARRLARYGSVLVQGPPGTGKTHTIANLIGHLLAEGQTVLVTSHTTKALRVLREKVVEQLQPLCVSVLEGDAESNAQLQNAVTEIDSRLSSASEDQFRREAGEIRAARRVTLARIVDARRRLLEVVQSEYSALVLNGREYSPVEAARKVFDGVGTNSWIPGKIQLGIDLPLSSGEVNRLYELNGRVTDGDVADLAANLPDLNELLSPDEFEETVTSKRHLGVDAAYTPTLWTKSAVRTASKVDALQNLANRTFADLDMQPAWFLPALVAASRANGDERPWQLLRDALTSYYLSLREKRLAVTTFAPELQAAIPAQAAARAIEEILAQLRSGKSLGHFGIMRKTWSQIVKGSSVLGHHPATIEDFDALLKTVAPASQLAKLIPRWNVLMVPLGTELPEGDEAGVEKVLALLNDALQSRIGLVAECRSASEAIGFDLGSLFKSDYSDPIAWWKQAATAVRDELPKVIRGELARLRIRELEEKLVKVTSYLDELKAARDSLAGRLRAAVVAEAVEDYRDAYTRLRELVQIKALSDERDALLLRLSFVAPEWAAAIKRRTPPHDAGLPGDVDSAWEWKQLAQSLEERSAIDAGTVIKEISQLRAALRVQTTELIDRLAWAAQAGQVDQSTRMALRQYVLLVKKIGKGTGRRVPRLRAAAREKMSEARAAVPVWIAPLNRVAEAFDPRKPKFDVVIIDEASQSDVLALITWYMGKKIIVVGDDQQVTPMAVGQRIDDITSMIDAHLQGIPRKELYDGQSSIYHLASTAFRGVVKLREHFRCVPEIISFSNSLSYDGNIVPLRDPSNASVGPAVIAHRVEGSQTNHNNINETEAREVASLLVACTEQPEYANLTFGVISLLGNEQSQRIEQIIRNRVTPKEYQDRRILCGAPPHFQGDERDVIFLSLVDSPPESPPLPRRGDPGELFKKRYNVAASRARDQLWVVHSLDRHRDLQTDDLRWRLLEWAADPNATSQRKQTAAAHAGSPFETQVLNRLIDNGYKVTPQYPVGAYRIDIVVEGGGNRLAIECDGEAYHSTDEQVRNDLDRQALLERMGWHFYRIRGSAFYRDPDSTMLRLFNELNDRGILPESTYSASNVQEDDLLRRVRERASELRDEWWGEQSKSSYVGSAVDDSSNSNPIVQSSESEELTARTASASHPASQPPARIQSASVTTQQWTQVKISAASDTGSLGSVRTPDDAILFFHELGFRVIDNRAKGGALWVRGSLNELKMNMEALRKNGLVFKHNERQNAWFLT